MLLDYLEYLIVFYSVYFYFIDTVIDWRGDVSCREVFVEIERVCVLGLNSRGFVWFFYFLVIDFKVVYFVFE